MSKAEKRFTVFVLLLLLAVVITIIVAYATDTDNNNHYAGVSYDHALNIAANRLADQGLGPDKVKFFGSSEGHFLEVDAWVLVYSRLALGDSWGMRARVPKRFKNWSHYYRTIHKRETGDIFPSDVCVYVWHDGDYVGPCANDAFDHGEYK